MDIKEARSLPVTNKIITLENAFKLAEAIQTIGHSANGCREVILRCKAECADNSKYESASIELFAPASPLARKRVRSIRLSVDCLGSNAGASISLEHGEWPWSHFNMIEVHGLDPHWVNGNVTVLSELLDSFKPQNAFVRNYKAPIEAAFALSIGIIILFFLRHLVAPLVGVQFNAKSSGAIDSLARNSPLLLGVAKYSLCYFFGLLPADGLYKKLSNLWPAIEIQIGPEHTQVEKKRRIWVSTVFLVGVAPLMVSAVYDIVKYFALPH